MSEAKSVAETVAAADLPVALDRDVFLRTLLRHLSGTLEEVVGLDEAEGFVSLVGQQVGDLLNQDYRQALGAARLSADQVVEVLIDLKRRINGDFYIESVSADSIVLRNRRCPFGEKVADRNSLCMMTSSVFGTITAENLGYAKVHLDETIARGDSGCRVVINLTETAPSGGAAGIEYFQV